MNRLCPLLLLACVLFLSGCAHYVWIKPGGDPATFPADDYACRQESMAAAPPVYETYVPMNPSIPEVLSDCHTARDGGQRCRTRVVQRPSFPDRPYTVDLNEGNRENLHESCLRARGWVLQRVEE